MKLLSIDPGTMQSGWVILDGFKIVEHGISVNEILSAKMLDLPPDAECVIEMVACYGMPVGAEVFDTCVWIGRFMQCWRMTFHKPARRIYRRDIKHHLCNSVKAKDANIRQAVMDKYPPTGRDGKGNQSVVGTKSSPGPLYGIKSHEWAALALGITLLESGHSHTIRHVKTGPASETANDATATTHGRGGTSVRPPGTPR